MGQDIDRKISYDAKTALVAHPPNREVIDAVVKSGLQFKTLGDVKQLSVLSPKLETGSATAPLSSDRIKSFYTKVDTAASPVDSALARLIIDSTVLVPNTEFVAALKASWNQFLAANPDPEATKPWYLFLNDKIGSEHWVLGLLWDEVSRFPFDGLLSL